VSLFYNKDMNFCISRLPEGTAQNGNLGKNSETRKKGERARRGDYIELTAVQNARIHYLTMKETEVFVSKDSESFSEDQAGP
jgi:hypothetical protein